MVTFQVLSCPVLPCHGTRHRSLGNRAAHFLRARGIVGSLGGLGPKPQIVQRDACCQAISGLGPKVHPI